MAFPVARSELLPIRSLLPETLRRLSERSGRAAPLLPLWRAVFAGPIAQNAAPRTFLAGVLEVEVTSAAWRETLGAQELLLRERLNRQLARTPVRRIVFQLAPP